MELKTFLEILKKNFPIIVFLSVLGIVLAYYFSSNFQNGYTFEKTFYITFQDVPTESTIPSQELKLDNANSGYFTQEKARNFTDSALAILQSPDFSRELESEDQVTARKLAPQVIKLTVTSLDPQAAKILMDKTVKNFNKSVASITSTNFELKPVGQAANPAKTTLSKKVLLVFGALAGFSLSLTVIGLKTYFRL